MEDTHSIEGYHLAGCLPRRVSIVSNRLSVDFVFLHQIDGVHSVQRTLRPTQHHRVQLHPCTASRFPSRQDYRAVYDALNSCVQHGHDSYMLNFHFLHIAGLSDTLVQLVGAVLNLDLDTLLDITPTNTSVEVAPPLLPPRSSAPSITTFTSHCRGSAPRSSPPRAAGSCTRTSPTRYCFLRSTQVTSPHLHHA